ncbi:uncharacterized protein LOC136067701 [Quercus suber]|uniref:uncharacterized protein LOC136067701 n=1 Tax=Quercus suber TaxID=58331 RepID=UPI0032DF669F
MEEDEIFDEFYAKLKDIVNSAFNLKESIAKSKIVWQAVEVDWIKPKRALVDWDDATIIAENFNSRALNALFCGLANEVFKKISFTEVAKEAWTILKTTYEGTKVVKTVKLQRLTSSFEEIRMEEDEIFDELYVKLKDIMNSAFNLGESIAESKIVRKILRSLLERLHAKIIAIEEVKEIDKIHSIELVGNLQTYEMRLGSTRKGGKSKNLALKGIEEEIKDSEDEDESEDDDEDLTFITDEIIKLLQFKQSKSSRKGKNKKPLIQCHECKGFSHIRIKCLNYLMKEKTKKSKDKGLVATWSDTENDSFDEFVDECCHVIAFATTTDKVIMESASDSEDSSSDETTRLVETLVVKNTSLEENVKNLEVELSQVRTQIERISSAKFDEILSAQKPSSDKTDLGYVVSSSPSSSTASRSRTIFVPQSEKGDKGVKFKTDLSNSNSFIKPHVCYHCGVAGHIHPNCLKLYPHKQLSKWSQVSSQGPTPLFGELLKVLNFLTQFQENYNSSMSFSRHTRTRAFSSSRPKTRTV